MILIFTLDDKNGTSIGGKRQSKDRVVADKIIELSNNQPICMKAKSTTFFNDASYMCKIRTIDSFDELHEDSIFFAEEVVQASVMEAAEKIIVFRWNRNYPSLVTDRVSLDGYNKEIADEFKGYSHDKITMEVYTR